MNIFKKIALINKISKEIKFVKKILKQNNELAESVKNVINCLKADITALCRLIPSLKVVYEEIMDGLKND